MSTSPNLNLPFIDPNQNQKSVTHNAALLVLDALVNLHAQSNALAAPPATPAEGQCWIVPSGGSGAWAGQDLSVAAWQDGTWAFYPARKGMVAFVDSVGGALMFTGTAWVPIIGAVSDLSLTALAVGTAVDTANPISAKLNAALFAALPTTAGGTGDVRLSLSKQAVGNTASLLFQDAFSGRAEIGLAGDDALRFKVSADGTTFVDAIDIAAASGIVSFGRSPTAPTPPATDLSTALATTAFVRGATAAAYTRAAIADADASLGAGDRVAAVTALTAARVIHLAAAAAVPAGTVVTIVDESGACSASRTLTVQRSGSDLINGAASIVLSSAYAALAVLGDGAGKWTVVAAH